MSILADSQIRRLAETEGLVEPYYPKMIQPTSLEVTLGDDHVIEWTQVPNEHGWVQVERSLPCDLQPGGSLVLASTAETIKMPTNLSGTVSGKSSLGRMGIFVHVTAGHIDPGFHGQITLEMLNMSPVPFSLVPGMKIGQIIFSTVLGEVERPYGQAGNHYQNQRGPTLANTESLKRPEKREQ